MTTHPVPNEPFCKYHPTITAGWFCRHCQISFCRRCVPQQKMDAFPNCSLCRKSLTRLSIAKDVPQFWNRLSLFFMTPLSKNIFIMLMVYSFVGANLPPGFIGYAIFVLVLIPFISAQFDLLECVSSGRKIHFSASQLLKSKQSSLTIKVFLVAGLVVLLVSKSRILFGDFVGNAMTVFFLLGVAASIAIFIMEKNILSPLNPIKIIALINVFGKAYWFLFGTIMFCSFLILKIYQASVATSSGFIASFLLLLFCFYLITVIFLMIGYLLYQHHIELNFVINTHQAIAGEANKNSSEEGLAIVEIYLQEGRFEDAQTLLLKKVEQDPLDYKANEKLILLFAALNKSQFSQKLIEQYFSLLISLNKNKHAADFYCLLQQRGFLYQASSADMVLALVPCMNNLEQYSCALTLIDCCSNEPAKEMLWDELALIKAKILIEYGDDKEAAGKLLQSISRRSLNQSLLEEADKMGYLLKRLVDR